jgi:hypothetical protein
MKQFLLIPMAAFVLAACNNEKKESANEAKEDNAGISLTNLPMPATYSSSFKLGNPAYATTIVQGSWKDWDDNKLDNMKNWIADTIVAFHSDNKMIQGLDSMMANWKRSRAGYSSVVDSIDAVIPVYSTDKKEDWVLVWARSYGVKTDGTKDTAAIMETWRFNKDGKADLLLQYDRAKRKK